MQLLTELETLSPSGVTERLPCLDQALQSQHPFMQAAAKAPATVPTWDAKRRLAISISNLNMDFCYGLIEVLQSCHCLPDSEDEELRLDLDALPPAVLQKLAVRPALLSSVWCDCLSALIGSFIVHNVFQDVLCIRPCAENSCCTSRQF
jgi:hypothetical protein